MAGFLQARHLSEGGGIGEHLQGQGMGRSALSGGRGAAVLQELKDKCGAIPLALAEETDVFPVREASGETEAANKGGFCLPEAVQRALLLPGSCVEVGSLPGGGAWSVVLQLMRLALLRSSMRWLGVLEVSEAYGFGQLQVSALHAHDLPPDRVLVVRTAPDKLRKMFVRLSAQSFFSALLIDFTSMKDLGGLDTALRRVAMNARKYGCTVFVMTSLQARRPRSLPMAVRAVVRPEPVRGKVKIEILKHREGRFSPLSAGLPVSLSMDHMVHKNKVADVSFALQP